MPRVFAMNEHRRGCAVFADKPCNCNPDDAMTDDQAGGLPDDPTRMSVCGILEDAPDGQWVAWEDYAKLRANYYACFNAAFDALQRLNATRFLWNGPIHQAAALLRGVTEPQGEALAPAAAKDEQREFGPEDRCPQCGTVWTRFMQHYDGPHCAAAPASPAGETPETDALRRQHIDTMGQTDEYEDMAILAESLERRLAAVSAELAHIKEVEFPRRFEKVNNMWRQRAETAESALSAAQTELAYAAFKGVFDTPTHRMYQTNKYVVDARDRLRAFNEVLTRAASAEGESAPSIRDAAVKSGFDSRIFDDADAYDGGKERARLAEFARLVSRQSAGQE